MENIIIIVILVAILGVSIACLVKSRSSKDCVKPDQVFRVYDVYKKEGAILLNGFLQGEVDFSDKAPLWVKNVSKDDKLYLSLDKPADDSVELTLKGVSPYGVGMVPIGNPSTLTNDLFDSKGNLDSAKYQAKYCKDLNNPFVKLIYHFGSDSVNAFIYMGDTYMTSKNQSFGTPIYKQGQVVYLSK